MHSHYKPMPHSRNIPRLSTGEAIAAYLASYGAKWQASSTETRRYHLEHFARVCPTLPDAPEPIEQFLSTIPNRQYRYNHWSAVRAFYTWLARRWGVTNPCPLVEAPQKPKSVPYWLEEADLLRLLCHPSHPPRDRALLFLLADTGLRIGEAASMRADAMGDDWIEVTGKTGKRFVPVNPRVLAMVRAVIHPRGRGAVWCGKRGPMSKNGLQYAVRQAFRRAGFSGERMSPHRLRHTFATLWDGQDSDAMDIGGWSNWETYRVYKTARVKRLTESQQLHSPLAQLGLL